MKVQNNDNYDNDNNNNNDHDDDGGDGYNDDDDDNNGGGGGGGGSGGELGRPVQTLFSLKTSAVQRQSDFSIRIWSQCHLVGPDTEDDKS